MHSRRVACATAVIVLPVVTSAHPRCVPAQQAPQGIAPTPAPSLVPEPAHQLLAYPAEEDWRFLKDQQKQTDPFDGVKYIPIGNGGAYASVGGAERLYYEAFTNENFGSLPGSDGYLELQTVLHRELVPSRKFRLYTSLQYNNLGHRRSGPRPGEDADFGDVLEGFAEVRSEKLDDVTGAPLLTARIGRQELDFGSGPLFSGRSGPNGEGTNVLGSFDAVRFISQIGKFRIDAFAARPDNDPIGAFDDGSSPGNNSWGIYATHDIAKSVTQVLDIYYFGVSRPQAIWYSGSGFETRHIVGARTAKTGTPLDYDAEGFFQFGANNGRPIRAEG